MAARSPPRRGGKDPDRPAGSREAAARCAAGRGPADLGGAGCRTVGDLGEEDERHGGGGGGADGGVAGERGEERLLQQQRRGAERRGEARAARNAPADKVAGGGSAARRVGAGKLAGEEGLAGDGDRLAHLRARATPVGGPRFARSSKGRCLEKHAHVQGAARTGGPALLHANWRACRQCLSV